MFSKIFHMIRRLTSYIKYSREDRVSEKWLEKNTDYWFNRR